MKNTQTVPTIGDRVELTTGEIGILKFQGYHAAVIWFEDEDSSGGCFVTTSNVAKVL